MNNVNGNRSALIAALAVGLAGGLAACGGETTPATAPATGTGSDVAPAPASNVARLGEDATLTAGIPGEGDLTVEEIRAWLDDPRNHEVLEVKLPLGLHVGAGQEKGLDANPLTRAKIELGRQLYFDGRLSADGTISCATCHAPDTGWTANTKTGVGIRDQTGPRNSPVAFNRILSA